MLENVKTVSFSAHASARTHPSFVARMLFVVLPVGVALLGLFGFGAGLLVSARRRWLLWPHTVAKWVCRPKPPKKHNCIIISALVRSIVMLYDGSEENVDAREYCEDFPKIF